MRLTMLLSLRQLMCLRSQQAASITWTSLGVSVSLLPSRMARCSRDSHSKVGSSCGKGVRPVLVNIVWIAWPCVRHCWQHSPKTGGTSDWRGALFCSSFGGVVVASQRFVVVFVPPVLCSSLFIALVLLPAVCVWCVWLCYFFRAWWKTILC